MKNIFTTLIVPGILLSTLAHASVPPSLFLLKNWLQKRGHFAALKVRSQIVSTKNDNTTLPTPGFQSITLWDQKTEHLRVKILDLKGKELYLLDRKNVRVLPIVPALLLSNSTDNISRSLRAKGITILSDADLDKLTDEAERRAAEMTFLARTKSGQPLWGVGQLGGHRILFEKDTFILSRIDRSESAPILFEDFRTVKENFWPRKIEIEGLLKEDILEIKEVDLPELLSKPETGFTPFGKEQDQGLQDLVLQYTQALR